MNSAKYLNDKPLVFTEWGGHFVYNNPKLMGEFLHEMNRLYMNANDEAALAGASFWFWAELNDFNRGRPACIEGNLFEGLVTPDRKPTMVYDVFCQGIKAIGISPAHDPFWFEGEPLQGGTPLFCAQSKAEALEILNEGIAHEQKNQPSQRARRLEKAPVLENVQGLSSIPFTLTDGGSLEFTCNAAAKEINIVGLVSLKKGYPLKGTYGEDVAILTVNYASGEREEHVLKNGVDITTVFALMQSSRINPVAENSRRFAAFGYDKNFENYIMNIQGIKTHTEEKINNITVTSCGNGYTLLIYAVSI